MALPYDTVYSMYQLTRNHFRRFKVKSSVNAKFAKINKVVKANNCKLVELLIHGPLFSVLKGLY